MTDIQQVRDKLQRFANQHKVIFEDEGEIGFGRPCVGFLRGPAYLSYNPLAYPDLDPVFEHDPRLEPPESVKDAYHKGDYLAVLVRDGDYDEALRQLARWVEYLETWGTAKVVQYPTGAKGTQAIFSGLHAWAVTLESAEVLGD